MWQFIKIIEYPNKQGYIIIIISSSSSSSSSIVVAAAAAAAVAVVVTVVAEVETSLSIISSTIFAGFLP